MQKIYDFITLPRDLSDVVYGDYESDRTIILGELFRMNEFAKLAENKKYTEPGGYILNLSPYQRINDEIEVQARVNKTLEQ